MPDKIKVEDLDIFANDMEPELRLYVRHHVTIQPPNMHHKTGTVRRPIMIRVTVDPTGYIELESAYGFGDISLNVGVEKMYENNGNRQDVFNYLEEWELAAWKMIGPEDSEIFATKKLDPEWGI